MKKVFVSNSEFPRKLTRTDALGYKEVIISEGVSPADVITMRTDGDKLVIEKIEDDSEEEPVFCILCKDFGLFGFESKFKSKISYILCDDGWMLVTLHRGAFVVNLDDKLLMPSTGVENIPNLNEEDVLWIDKDYLLRYTQYMRDKENFPYDFEFMVELSGSYVGSLSSFKFLHITEEDVDMSLGKYALYQQNLENKAKAKNAKKLQAQVVANSSVDMEFDDDEEEDYEDEDDYEDDDWD